MSASCPFVAALLPTFCRPQMLATSLACWASQFYDSDQQALVVGLDSDDPADFDTDALCQAVMRFAPRRRGVPKVLVKRCDPKISLPAKYNQLARAALLAFPVDLFAVWEDDDLYFPGHLNRIATAWDRDGRPPQWWGHPRQVWSEYHDSRVPKIEDASGRFHAALAVSRGMWSKAPWVNTERADFDQQYLAKLRSLARPSHYDHTTGHMPRECGPTYCFRWHTGHLHGQTTMRSADDTEWRIEARDRLKQSLTAADADTSWRSAIRPQIGFDSNAVQLLTALGQYQSAAQPAITGEQSCASC